MRSFIKRKPYAFFLLWALFALLPNSNLVPIRIERADRYYYLASMGFCALAGYGVAVLAGLLRRRVLFFLSALLFFLLTCLGTLSFKQVGFWRNAPVAWARVLSIYPELTLARVALGNSYFSLGDYERALEQYRSLLDRPVPNTEALKGTALILLEQGQKQRARALLELGSRLAPVDEDFPAVLGRFYLNEGKNGLAGKYILRWLELDPESQQALLSLAELRLRESRRLEGAEILENLIRKNPRDPALYDRVAMLYLEAGDTAKARLHLEKALGLAPGSRAARLHLAYLYSRTGEKEKARRIYAGFPLEELDLGGLEFMGAYYFERGDLKKSLSCFRRMTLVAPKLPRAFNNSGVVYEKMGRYAEADSMYTRAIALDSSFTDAFFNRGNLLVAMGDNHSAVEHYKKADSLAGGKDGAVLEALTRTLLAVGDTAQAQQYAARLKALHSLKSKE